jgi:hypothetical protein
VKQQATAAPVVFWNLQMPDRYSNLSSLTSQDLGRDILTIQDPSQFRKYSNSKGMNVIVSDGIDSYKPLAYSHDLASSVCTLNFYSI